jgi:peroxiredoxin
VKLQNTYAKKGFEVVGVSVDSAEMEGQIAPFVEETGINYPVVLDPRGVIADVFETNILPTSALIDRDGNVVWTHIGMVEADDEQLLSALREVL